MPRFQIELDDATVEGLALCALEDLRDVPRQAAWMLRQAVRDAAGPGGSHAAIGRDGGGGAFRLLGSTAGMKGERVVALTTTDTFSQKSRSFLVALDALCKHHGILLSVSGDDALQLWDLDTDVGEPWWCTGIVDMTMPDVPEDIPR